MAARRGGFRRALRMAAGMLVLALALPYFLVPLYAFGRPVSTLMLGRWLTLRPVERTWRDLGAISPQLSLAVVVAEDARFCSHGGIDWEAFRQAVEDASEGEAGAGGSTITQQVAKNLFLWPGRSYLRKALEVPLALWIDAILPKRRVLELYLNVAEWGPNGQFGAEAGARAAFGRPAGTLTRQEAAQMAAILPNPIARSAGRPGPDVRRRAAIYTGRMAGAGELTGCLSGRE